MPKSSKSKLAEKSDGSELVLAKKSKLADNSSGSEKAAPSWPTPKRSAETGSSGPALLLTTGAMNPMHLGHAAMLHKAAERLTRAGYGVRGAYASPSHDGYVLPKAKTLKTIGLSAAFRLEVASRMVGADELVSIAAWEASRPGLEWPDFDEVCAALQAEAPADTSVFYVCGTDHADKCGLWGGLGGLGVVVVPREGEKPKAEQPAKRVFIASMADGDAAGFSSTKVRAAIIAGDREGVDKMLSPDAARLLLAPSAEESAAFASDYAQLGAS